MNNTRLLLILSTAAITVGLVGCSGGEQKAPNAAATVPASSATSGSTATATSPEPAKPTTASPEPAKSTVGSSATTDNSKPGTESGAASKLPSNIHVNLAGLPDDLVICTVGDTPITVTDYRRELKLQQLQIQNQMQSDPAMRAQLLAMAQQSNLSLTPDELNTLVASAKSQHKGNFEQFLKERHLTEEQFNREVKETGLELKAAEAHIESMLLPEMVNREMMVKAADANQRKAAETKWQQVANTSDMKNIKQQSGLAEDALQKEFVKAELSKLQMQTVANKINISDAEINNWYKNNKSQLKHAERVRISSILIAAPEQDIGPIKSIRTQMAAANPKLQGKDLEAAVAKFMMEQQNKALILLGTAQAAPGQFAKLANEQTQDMQQHIARNGGDMGWQEKKQLVPDFAGAIWDLKPGAVLPKLVKTGEGYRIVKVTGHEPAGSIPLSEVKPLVVMKLRAERTNDALQKWVSQRQQQVKVEFTPRFLAIAKGTAQK